MVDCKARGLKLMIALSDRYALGFWSTDSYATQLNIVAAGSSGVQKVANAGSFYTNAWAINMFEDRLSHIMNHQNALMGGQKWADLDEVIYAVEPQNEPQGHMQMASSTWSCDRARYLKSLITSNIKVSSGGGITTSSSLGSWATGCSAFDIISVHDYGTSAAATAGALAAAKAAHPGKEVIMGEWGMAGANKATVISQFVNAFNAQGISNMFWQITKPGAGAADFEVWTGEGAWKALTGQAFSNDAAPVVSASKAVASSSKAAASFSSKAVASFSKVADSSKEAAAREATSTKAQWASATSAFSSYVAKASSYAGEGKSRVASAYSAAASKVESAAAEATSAAAAANTWSGGAAGQRQAIVSSLKGGDA
ncbi:glycoside hydrolase family 5 protein [Rhodotorula graminis WP1]|uniref:Glycoside hydrolase family 5 protein n=1 Tax=Rhodotorula graminis (strain WP1) TaxID=578459 RepID=A0A194S3E6_RHOGW|nr:glycoside hydrolase family 5 protein [Rhodotorula graminis WP1]KPV75112.1 glycoside hydrolase family 5 protein [Rhodotorula graminis WP1]